MQILYTATATATGGRNGHVSTSDQVLSLDLALPKELGGPGGAKTNPEQLFAAGYAACFDNALQRVAREQKLKLEASLVAASVGLGRVETGYALEVHLEVKISGLERETAEQLVKQTHLICPYSNAIRGNVEVTTVVI